MAESTPSVGTVLVAHPGAELYGSDRMMLETVRGLVERRWRVVVAVPQDGPLVEEVRRLGAETVLLDVPVLRKSLLRPAALAGFALASLAAARRIDALLADVRPQAVYVSTLTVPLWILRGRRRRIPVVCHVHESERRARRAVRRLLALPLVLADAVLVNSAFSRDSLLDVLPSLADRSTVVLNGVAAGPRTPARDAVDGAARLLYIGRLSPRKGVDVAIAALLDLVRSGTHAELTLVGDVFPGYEWYREQLLAQIEGSGLGDRVHLAGFRAEVWGSLSEADVVLVPSREEEPFGNTAVEALLAGRPVVVSDIGGLPEAVEGFPSALTVPPDDPRRLADGVRKVLGSWSAFGRSAAALAPVAAARFEPAAYRAAVAAHVARVADVDAPLPARALVEEVRL